MNKYLRVISRRISIPYNQQCLARLDKSRYNENIKHRVRSYQTGSPFRDYQVVYSVKHPDYLLAEKKIRQQMEYFASDIRNEWFKVDLQIAKDRLVEQLDNYFYGECDQSQKYNNYKYERQVELVKLYLQCFLPVR